MPRLRTSDVVDEETRRCSWADLGLAAPLLRSLGEMGCERPSPVQLRTIPAALDGSDVVVQAKSGTGKTIAFCAVLLQLLDVLEPTCQGLVLAPTRELALQVTDELRRLAWHLPGFAAACFIGGMPAEEDYARLSVPLHVAVGTPGRTLKLLRERRLQPQLRLLVLDEADKLLEPAFRQDIQQITELAYTEDLQFLAVSATFPPPLITEAEALFARVEKKRGLITRPVPKLVLLCTSAVKRDGEGKVSGNAESAVLKGVLHFKLVQQGYHVKQKLPALLEVLTRSTYQQALVFCDGPDSAIQIAEMLSQAGIPAVASAGKMGQTWRSQAFAGLKLCQYRVLCCTDLFARGVDVEWVDIVVNLSLPVEKETYLHRSGRTARFGSIGCSVSIVFEGDEEDALSFFQMQLGFALANFDDHAEAMASHAAAFGGSTPAQDERPGGGKVQDVPAAAQFAAASSRHKKVSRETEVHSELEKVQHVAPSAWSVSQQGPAQAIRLPKDLVCHMPPPVLLGLDTRLPLDVQALLPEWLPWMLRCRTFAEYSDLHQSTSSAPVLGGQQSSVAVGVGTLHCTPATCDRMNALWANHFETWTSVHP